MKNWTKADMRKVRDAIAEAVPEAVFHESDYGWGLAVSVKKDRPSPFIGVTLFNIEYYTGEDGEPVAGTTTCTDMDAVPLVVSWLKEGLDTP